MYKTSCSLTFTGKNSLFSNDEINIVALEGEEGVSSLYHFDITIAVATNNANSQWSQMKKMLNEPVKLLLTYHHKEASKEEKLQWHGMITSVIQDGRDDEHCYYQLLLEPKVAKLRWLFSSDVYLEKQLDDIIHDVMKQAKFDAFEVIRKQALQSGDNHDYLIDSDEDDKFSNFLPHSYQHFTCQFEESSLDFLQRRLEFYGVHYCFSQLDEKACMVFSYDLKVPEKDSPKILKAEYNAVYSSEATHDSIAITHLNKRLHTHASQLYLQRSSSYFNTVEERLQPASHQLFKHSEETGSYYSSLDQFELLEKSNGDKPLENRCISGKYLAKIRAEAAQAKQAQVTGTAVNPGITAGRFIRIEDWAIETILRATDSDSEEGQRQNDYFVLSVKHRWGNSDKTQWKNKKSSLQNYQADFVLHPCFTEDDQPLPFYPQQRTPTPRIEHMVSGFIDGVPYKKQDNPNAPSTIDTSYPNIDEQGRYRVRFAFAKQLKASYAKNSAWVRLATPFAGGTPHREFDEKGQAVNTDKGYNYSGGMHFPLRPGTEVLIAFVNGDPDYPVIVSALPNVEAPSPVTCGMYSNNKVIQPDNRNQFVLQTPVGNRMTVHDIAPEKINGKWKDSTRSAWQFYTPAKNTQLNLGAFYYETNDGGQEKVYGDAGFMLSTQGKGIISAEDQILLQSNKSVKIVSGDVGDKFDKLLTKKIPGYGNQEKFEKPVIPTTTASEQPPAMTKEDIEKIIDDKTEAADKAKDLKDNIWKGNKKDAGLEKWLSEKISPWVNYKEISIAKPTFEPFKVTMGGGTKADLWIGPKVSVELGVSAKFSASYSREYSFAWGKKSTYDKVEKENLFEKKETSASEVAESNKSTEITNSQKTYTNSSEETIGSSQRKVGSEKTQFGEAQSFNSKDGKTKMELDASKRSASLNAANTNITGTDKAKIGTSSSGVEFERTKSTLSTGNSKVELSPETAEVVAAVATLNKNLKLFQ